jgi:Putative esterase
VSLLVPVSNTLCQISVCICGDADHRVNRSRRRRWRLARFLVFAAGLLLCLRIGALGAHAQNRPSLRVGAPTIDAHGVKYYPVTSIYQGSQHQIVRVLEPTNPAPGKPRRLLFVLPVESGLTTLSSTWSDGLEELRLLDVPNRFNMTLIAPSFNYEPWYGDNVTDPTHRMESFIIDDLVPFADTFAKGSVPQRYLIGFSKSGNGALTLILRHPKVFNAAASWDAPAQLNELSEFPALVVNFGTQANFELYDVPTLVASNAVAFQQQNRLWISGDQAAWTADMIALNFQLSAASIPHTWVQGGVRAHSWNSGWLDGAVRDLDANATLTASAGGTAPSGQSRGQPAGALAERTHRIKVNLTRHQRAMFRYGSALLGLLLVAVAIRAFLKSDRLR